MRRFIISLTALGVLIIAAMIGLPLAAAHEYGPAGPELSAMQLVEYSVRVLWDDGLLSRPLVPGGPEQDFTIDPDEPVPSVAGRLQAAGIISDASLLRDYLVYTGMDNSIQAGKYRLGPGMSVVDIARKLQDATPAEVTFVILPGWRAEEVAGSLPTSGLGFTPESFLAAVEAPHSGFDYLEGASSVEGFLYPDSYILPRTTTLDQFMDTLLRNFNLHLTTDLREGFDHQGLTVYQAVSLASIIQREAIQEEEAPIIASVYLNRLKLGMKLDADPTVQYALGYDAALQSWWTNPLSVDDLQFDSPYNTYRVDGLPPTPIDNPGAVSLQAVASPASTNYYYFSAKCDNSGYHNFAATFEEHLQNLCP